MSLVELADLEVFRDPRGELVVCGNGDGISFVEYVSFAEAGVVRGSHYHRAIEETLLVVSGALRGEFRAVGAAGGGEALTVAAGRAVVIPAGVAHRFTALAPSAAVVVMRGGSPRDDLVRIEPSTWGPV